MPTNLERMIQLADEFFQTKNDPSQISVTEEVMERLRQIHPATMSEHIEGDGPVAWILLIPSTRELMNQFIAKEITEQDLLNMTPFDGPFEAIYLCSALVLPEFRKKGLAKNLTCKAIDAIRNDHPIMWLFTWAFSEEGKRLAHDVATETRLQLLERVG